MQKAKKAQGSCCMAAGRRRLAGRQIHMLVGAENAARFCVLLPLLTENMWSGRGLGIFTAFCLAGCLTGGLLERLLWDEEQLFEALWRTGGRKTVMAVYVSLFWFFLAQAPVMLRLAGEVMLSGFRYSFFFLPFLISSACNSMIYMRKLFVRLYAEGPKGWDALAKNWFYRSQEVLWWGFVFLAVMLALAFADPYTVAGFYCAYNWQVMAAAAAVGAAVLRRSQKRHKKGL